MNHAPATFRFAIIAAAVVAVLFRITYTRADVDLWGHVRFGLDALEHQRLDRIDPYSFTSDRPWINHEWLSEVTFAAAWKLGGDVGLIATKLGCFLGAVAFVALSLSRQRLRARVLGMAVALAALAIVPRVTHVRPQLFSVLLFAALLHLFVRSERRPLTLCWTVPIFALWANLHGGWLVGLATLAIWAVGLSVYLRRIGVLMIPIAAAAATLVNPYGPGLWRFLGETVRLGREGITEWGPIWTNASRFAVWTVLAAAVIAAGLRARPANPARLMVPAAWGLAAFRVNRLDAFFALSVVVLLLPQLSDVLRGLWQPRDAASTPAAAHATIAASRWELQIRVLVCCIVLGAALLLPPARRAVTCVEVTPSWWPEPEAATFIRSQGLAGRMVTYFNWGEYAIWFAPATLKVSFDGRRETVYSDDVINGHLELYNATAVGFVYLQTLDPDYVWLPADLAVTRLLVEKGWRPIFTGPASVILADARKAALHPAVAIDASPIDARRCFPGP